MGSLKKSCLYYNDAIRLCREMGMDKDCLRHSKRVAQLFDMCVSDNQIMELLRRENGNVSRGLYILGALLHDIGKCYVPLEYLNKRGALTTQEFNAIKSHVGLDNFIEHLISSNFRLNMYEYVAICKMIQLHHENYDGSGYPYGVRGNAIPLYVKILSILDVYDALVSKRCYKMALSHDVALGIIMADSGKKFDENVLNFLIGRTNAKLQRFYSR